MHMAVHKLRLMQVVATGSSFVIAAVIFLVFYNHALREWIVGILLLVGMGEWFVFGALVKRAEQR